LYGFLHVHLEFRLDVFLKRKMALNGVQIGVKAALKLG
jgi:hypothetical protein